MKLTSLLVLSSAATMNAAVLVNEDFSYADGDLTTVGAPDWTAHSGATGTLLQVSGGAAVITTEEVAGKMPTSDLAPSAGRDS